MNGPQDLGGRMGFGPISPEEDEPVFHAEWEKRALGIVLSCGALGYWSIDESRHARERIPHADYLRFSYYRIWLVALISLLARHGELSTRELAEGRALRPGRRTGRRLAAADVPAVLARGGPSARDLAAPARFAVGDRVRTRNIQKMGHTRLPGYLRGHVGTIEALHGGHVFPDSSAHGRGECPQHLYTVLFEGEELWGNRDGVSVCADLWEGYLDPA